MSRQNLFVRAAFALACAMTAGVAQAHSTQWSVTVGNQPRGVVMVPQSQFSYGAPPSVYAPPAPVYVQPPPVIYVQPPPYPVYVNPPHGQRYGGHDRRHERWDRHDHDRRHWNDHRQGQWGYGSGNGYGYDRGHGHGHYRR